MGYDNIDKENKVESESGDFDCPRALGQGNLVHVLRLPFSVDYKKTEPACFPRSTVFSDTSSDRSSLYDGANSRVMLL
jgi:hypothetical protein